MSTPPLNIARPSMSAFTASMSRWLDGSSSSSICGRVYVNCGSVWTVWRVCTVWKKRFTGWINGGAGCEL
eukprot:153629-Chlamydomonas_euryale.AAC.1